MTCRPPWRERLGLFAVTTVAVVHALTFFFATSDDAFITLRYAQNLADGFGAVWNPGAPAVEGYSNPLFMFACAMLLVLGVTPLWTLKGLGLVGLVAALLGSAQLARRLSSVEAWAETDEPRFAGAPLFAAGLLGLLPAFAFWGVGGLETSLYAASIAWAASLTVGEINRGRPSAWTPLVWLLVALGRPEGFALALGVGGLTLGLVGRRSSSIRNWLLLFGLPLLAALLLRHHYYGAWVANTVVAKVTFGSRATEQGLAYLQAFVAAGGWALLLLAAFGAGLVFARKAKAQAFVVVALVGAQTLFVLLVGGDHMPAYRFLVPVLPLLAGLAAFAVSGLQSLENQGFARAGLLISLALVAAVFFGQNAELRGPNSHFMTLHNGAWHHYLREPGLGGTYLGAHWRIARHIRRRARAGDLLVTTEAGVLPYYSGLETIDLLGLNHREIAAIRHEAITALNKGETVFADGTPLANWPRRVTDLVFERKPRWIMIDGAFEAGTGAFIPRLDMAVWIRNHPDFRNYEPVARQLVYDASRSRLGRDRYDVLLERIPEGF